MVGIRRALNVADDGRMVSGWICLSFGNPDRKAFNTPEIDSGVYSQRRHHDYQTTNAEQSINSMDLALLAARGNGQRNDDGVLEKSGASLVSMQLQSSWLII